MSGLELIEVIALVINLIILFVCLTRQLRFSDSITVAMVQAALALLEWERQGRAFPHNSMMERYRHLWKLCDSHKKDVVQHRLKMIAGPNGYTVYQMLRARHALWNWL